jgi:hypothetical protein
LKKIYCDFMVYLMKHTQKFFEYRIVGGRKVWAEHHHNMTIVITHPNGWTLTEQSFLREAAITAGYKSREQSLTEIHFVSEAEASVHFCMFHSDLQNRFKVSNGSTTGGLQLTERSPFSGQRRLSRLRCWRIYRGHNSISC